MDLSRLLVMLFVTMPSTVMLLVCIGMGAVSIPSLQGYGVLRGHAFNAVVLVVELGRDMTCWQ